MLFNSLSFAIFLPLVFFLYWFVFKNSLKKQNALILIASYVFYGWWSWKFLLLLILSTLLDFFYGFGVASENAKRSKLFLWLSIINNLGILGIFKYYNFFLIQFSEGLKLLGINSNPVLLSIALPVGISFYTFHGMSYVFDIYKKKRKPVDNFIDYGVFVSFFPLLVAGPIERANHLLPQVQAPRIFNYKQAVQGCRLILWGMFKKVVIADNLALMADNIFKHYQERNAYTLIIGAVAFSFQIYGDFSGYSDIALGSAKLLGFELLSNFKFPYFSRNIAEFWRRWHISLSSWFRDYLYIPLGGSKNGKIKAVRNTFLIFLISGFWHGANFTFIVWGLIHACLFLPLLLINKNREYLDGGVADSRLFPNIRELFQMVTTFGFVTLAWIFFRSSDLTTGYKYLSRIFTDSIRNPTQFLLIPSGKAAFVYITPLVIMDWWLRRDERLLRNWGIVISILMGTAIYIFLKKQSSFIYFQF